METRQNMFNDLKATTIFLELINQEKKDDSQYLYSLFKFLIKISLEGNSNVQKTVYDHFMSSSTSEKFFRRIYSLLQKEISQADFALKSDGKKEITQLGMKILRLLQLFCEGHNLNLQNYLRHQTTSKNNYDLVTLITKLLSSYKVSSKNLDTIMQCLDTLTELIQVIALL